MVIRKANTYRLYPTPEQAHQMAQIAGSCRFVFNLALEQRREARFVQPPQGNPPRGEDTDAGGERPQELPP